MKQSIEVVDGLQAFYEAFNTGDVDRLATRISESEGVSVQGSAPGEGHDDRQSWLKAYAEGIAPAGVKLEGGADAIGFAENGVGFVRDEASFVMPNDARLRTRLTAVMREEGGSFTLVHAHFSVGVPDEQAIETPA